jgi:hypothetical protein
METTGKERKQYIKNCLSLTFGMYREIVAKLYKTIKLSKFPLRINMGVLGSWSGFGILSRRLHSFSILCSFLGIGVIVKPIDPKGVGHLFSAYIGQLSDGLTCARNVFDVHQI